MHKFLLLLGIALFVGCSETPRATIDAVGLAENSVADTYRIYTDTSALVNQYSGFNSVRAVNRIANMENEYFNAFKFSSSRYYGTVWAEGSDYSLDDDTTTVVQQYKAEQQSAGCHPDSMHCTLYAIEALEAGLDTNFQIMEDYHKKIYQEHEHAGWSVGYILVKHFGWKAYLVLNKTSQEYDRCMKYYKKNKTYYVWHQPDIPLSGLFDSDEDGVAIDSLLNQNEFGWGFSRQGYHTWITRFNVLKECNWGGCPSTEYNGEDEGRLFVKTKFSDYQAYQSHIIVFPPKVLTD